MAFLDSTWPILSLLSVALLGAQLLVKLLGASVAEGRFSSIDGLRGYLAFFVFIHHACIWFFYTHTGIWQKLDSTVYTHMGQSSVVLFFMITGFLFTTKLIENRRRPFDWFALYVARFFRLVPMYGVALTGFFIIAACVSQFKIAVPLAQLIKEILHWVAFTIIDDSELNAIPQVFTIFAGVTWSLRYEWYYYFSLPIVALLLGIKAPLPYLAFALCAVALSFYADVEPIFLIAFVSGAAASGLVRLPAFLRFARHSLTTVFMLVLVAVVVVNFARPYSAMSILLFGVVFALIAGGNSFFGLLTSAISRMLGNLAYSIYLLHGMLLFVTFNFVITPAAAMQFTWTQYWLLMVMVAAVLITLAFLSYRFVEAPGIQAGKTFTQWCRRQYPHWAGVTHQGRE